jgi:hypothetical protein
MLSDLAALTPPAVVCVAFLVGLVLLLRREMAPKRPLREDALEEDAVQEDAGREDADSERDISGNNDIIGGKARAGATSADDQDDASRSRDGRG